MCQRRCQRGVFSRRNRLWKAGTAILTARHSCGTVRRLCVTRLVFAFFCRSSFASSRSWRPTPAVRLLQACWSFATVRSWRESSRKWGTGTSSPKIRVASCASRRETLRCIVSTLRKRTSASEKGFLRGTPQAVSSLLTGASVMDCTHVPRTNSWQRRHWHRTIPGFEAWNAGCTPPSESASVVTPSPAAFRRQPDALTRSPPRAGCRTKRSNVLRPGFNPCFSTAAAPVPVTGPAARRTFNSSVRVWEEP